MINEITNTQGEMFQILWAPNITTEEKRNAETVASWVIQSSVLGWTQGSYFYKKHSRISRKKEKKNLGWSLPPLAYLAWNVEFSDPFPNCHTYLYKTKLSRISANRLKQWTKKMKCSRDKWKDLLLE